MFAVKLPKDHTTLEWSLHNKWTLKKCVFDELLLLYTVIKFLYLYMYSDLSLNWSWPIIEK